MTTKIGGDRWIKLFQRPFENNGHKGVWTFVSRNDNPPDTCDQKRPDAVFVAAILLEEGQPPRHVLTAEYRVPVGGFVIGFPAGLISPGESAADAAVREFKEETGLEFQVGHSSPLNLFSTPGLTDESTQIVFGTARGTPSSEFLEPSENIRTFLFTAEELRPLLFEDKPLGTIGWDCKTWPVLAAFSGGFGIETYFPKV